MSLWMCQHCHSLQGFAKDMVCFACGGPLEFTTVSEQLKQPGAVGSLPATPPFEDWASHIATDVESKSDTQLAYEIEEACQKAYRLGREAAAVVRPDPPQPDLELIRQKLKKFGTATGSLWHEWYGLNWDIEALIAEVKRLRAGGDVSTSTRERTSAAIDEGVS